jgi:hypothetical protein
MPSLILLVSAVSRVIRNYPSRHSGATDSRAGLNKMMFVHFFLAMRRRDMDTK